MSITNHYENVDDNPGNFDALAACDRLQVWAGYAIFCSDK